MAKGSKKRKSLVIALIASFALTLGIVPAQVMAAEGDGTSYDIQAAVTPEGAGEISGTGTYDEGATAVLTAEPNKGYVFDYWSETGSTEPVESAAIYTFTVTGARDLTAHFNKILVVGEDSEQIGDQTYTGNAIEPKVKVYLEGVDEALVKDKDYTVKYKDNVNVGKATVTVTLMSPGMEEQSTTDGEQSVAIGEQSATFQIVPADISTAKVKVDNQVYNGKELTPTPTVTWNKQKVGKDDYTLKYTNNVNVGTATVTVTGKHNFSTKSKTTGTFKITERPLTITADSAERVYDGTPLTADGFSSEGLAEGDSISSAKVEGSQTEIGSSANTVSDAKIINAKGKDVTANYSITYVPGTLTVVAVPVEKATLTFDLAGGTLDDKTGSFTITANVGDTITLPGVPTREGYAFKCWKGSEYAAGAEYKVEGDHTFTAEWVAEVAKHTVTFDANGHGTAPAAQSVEDGKTATKPADPVVSGWTFGGWYTDKACTTAYDFSTVVTADITLYAKWTQTATPAAKGSTGTTTPKTGDPSGWVLPVVIALVAGAGVCISLVVVSKRRRDRA